MAGDPLPGNTVQDLHRSLCDTLKVLKGLISRARPLLHSSTHPAPYQIRRIEHVLP